MCEYSRKFTYSWFIIAYLKFIQNMDVMKKNPFVLIPIIGVLIALFSVGKAMLPGGQINNGQMAMKKMQAANQISHQKMQAELEQLKKIQNPTDHNIWHMGHLEKSIAHLDRFVAPRFKASTYLAYHTLIPLSIVATIIIFALIYMWHHFISRSKYAPRSGLNNGSVRIHPNNDPIANKTHWQSMASSAANFKMQQLETSKTGFNISASFEIKLFCRAFIFGGLAPISIEYLFMWDNIEFILDPLLSVPSMFVLVGVILSWAFTGNNIEFNKLNRTIHTSERNIPFSEVYALQVISSLAGGHGHGVYRNNELNLVLNDGQRINLLNHGGIEAFEYQESQLSKLLNVPVWHA